MIKPFIIGTRNSENMLYAGVEVLQKGNSALDAIEAATRLVELNPDDTSVGLGGVPNLLGYQEMDASIMCGKTLKTGAVGAVKGFKHPISIARKVLDFAPHVLLVGQGAEHFAKVMGCAEGDLNTKKSNEIWEAFVKEAISEIPDTIRSKQSIIDYVENQDLHLWFNK